MCVLPLVRWVTLLQVWLLVSSYVYIDMSSSIVYIYIYIIFFTSTQDLSVRLAILKF